MNDETMLFDRFPAGGGGGVAGPLPGGGGTYPGRALAEYALARQKRGGLQVTLL